MVDEHSGFALHGVSDKHADVLSAPNQVNPQSSVERSNCFLLMVGSLSSRASDTCREPSTARSSDAFPSRANLFLLGLCILLL
jgi:hypothetical protein